VTPGCFSPTLGRVSLRFSPRKAVQREAVTSRTITHPLYHCPPPGPDDALCSLREHRFVLNTPFSPSLLLVSPSLLVSRCPWWIEFEFSRGDGSFLSLPPLWGEPICASHRRETRCCVSRLYHLLFTTSSRLWTLRLTPPCRRASTL